MADQATMDEYGEMKLVISSLIDYLKILSDRATNVLSGRVSTNFGIVMVNEKKYSLIDYLYKCSVICQDIIENSPKFVVKVDDSDSYIDLIIVSRRTPVKHPSLPPVPADCGEYLTVLLDVLKFATRLASWVDTFVNIQASPDGTMPTADEMAIRSNYIHSGFGYISGIVAALNADPE